MPKTCQICGEDGEFECPLCGAFAYCSKKHARLHHRAGHAQECSRMAGQMSKALVGLVSYAHLLICFRSSFISGSSCNRLCSVQEIRNAMMTWSWEVCPLEYLHLTFKADMAYRAADDKQNIVTYCSWNTYRLRSFALCNISA